MNNASQAMEGSSNGKIEVRTRADDTNVYVDVIDNGKGMSQQIMEQHNGDITAVSTEGVGTTFTLTLPIHNDLNEKSLSA